jgi:hypothetical protein
MTPIRDDPDYWDALAGRVAAAAAGGTATSGFDWLARSRAAWVAASLVAVAVVVITRLPADEPSAASFRTALVEVSTPSDDAGTTIVLRDRPPAIGVLLISGGAEGAR